MTKNFFFVASITYRYTTFMVQFNADRPLSPLDVINWMNKQGYTFVHGRDKVVIEDLASIPQHDFEERDFGKRYNKKNVDKTKMYFHHPD